jgi:Flp pilus assembly pilin Flp
MLDTLIANGGHDNRGQLAHRRTGIGNLRGCLAWRDASCELIADAVVKRGEHEDERTERRHRDQRVDEGSSDLHYFSPLKRNRQGASQLPFRRRSANQDVRKRTIPLCLSRRLKRARAVCSVSSPRAPTRIAVALTDVLPRTGSARGRRVARSRDADARKRPAPRCLRPVLAVSQRPVAQRLRYVATSARSCSEPDRNSHTALRASSARGGNAMMNLITRMRAFARNEEAQDLIEYALLVGLISLVAVAAIGLAGGSVNTIFGGIAAELQNAATP